MEDETEDGDVHNAHEMDDSMLKLWTGFATVTTPRNTTASTKVPNSSAIKAERWKVSFLTRGVEQHVPAWNN